MAMVAPAESAGNKGPSADDASVARPGTEKLPS
jgi:hypothetical protein